MIDLLGVFEPIQSQNLKPQSRSQMFLFDPFNSSVFSPQEVDLKPVFKSPSLGYAIMSFSIAKNSCNSNGVGRKGSEGGSIMKNANLSSNVNKISQLSK